VLALALMTTRFGAGIVTIRCTRFENGGPPAPAMAQAGCMIHEVPPWAEGAPADAEPPGAR
jgi:hypothetical protein